MEEDIKIIEELENWNKEHNISTRTTLAIESLLKAYKQDEKMIDILIKYIDRITEELAREKGVEDFEFCDNRCADIEDYIECKDCIKEYFRKKVKDE